MSSEEPSGDDLIRVATAETFADHVGSEFRIVGLDTAVTLVLTSAREIGPSADAAAATRRPFSLLFSGPAGAPIDQRTFEIEHKALGRFHVFLVPIEPDADGRRYEAVFG